MTHHHTKNDKNNHYQKELYIEGKENSLFEKVMYQNKKNLLERKSPKHVQTPHTTYI